MARRKFKEGDIAIAKYPGYSRHGHIPAYNIVRIDNYNPDWQGYDATRLVVSPAQISYSNSTPITPVTQAIIYARDYDKLTKEKVIPHLAKIIKSGTLFELKFSS